MHVSINVSQAFTCHWHAHQVLHALEELDEHLARLGLRKLLLHHNPIEQLALWRQLQHQVHTIHFVESVLQTQHIRMADRHQHCDLLLQALYFTPLAWPGPLLELLDSEVAPIRLACRKVHGCEVALAQLAFNAILL